MGVREHRSSGGGLLIPTDSELAHRTINIRSELERQYLHSILASNSGDVAKAWLNYRRIGEVRYGITRSARIAGYGRFVAVQVNERNEIVRTKESGVEAEEVARITSRFGGTRGLIERYYALMKIPGQAFPIRVREGDDAGGAEDGLWFLSASEIAREDDHASKARKAEPVAWKMRRSGGGTAITRPVQPADFLGRVWSPDFEFTEDASSPMQSISSMCEQLHTLTESISGRLRQRFAMAGMLLIPTEINDAAISGERPADGLFSNDKVLNYLIHVMTTNLANHAAGMARIPIVLKGPQGALEAVRHLVMDSSIDETDLRLRGELIGRILTALDQQKSAVEGMEDQNHWGAWMVSDEERRITVQPDLEHLCHALTRLVLWPALRKRKRTEKSLRQWRVWFDLSAASVRANLSEDARQGWDRGAVSNAFLRLQMGATDDDMPSPDEYTRMLGWKMNNPILATYGLEGIEVDWDRAQLWGNRTGPKPASPGEDPEAGPGAGDPGSPDDRDSDTPKTEEPG